MTATQVQVHTHPVPFFLSTVTHLSPFPMSQALPLAVEYYEDSVALSLAAFRRSRIDARQTYSAFRCPSSSPSTCPLQVARHREPLPVIRSNRLVWRCRFRCAATGVRYHRWRLGFNQSRLHPAHRTCGATPYTSSAVSAFPPSSFPPCLST